MSKNDPDRFDRAILAWHASPYDFDEFGPMHKVSGSGQGAAMYGRGAAYVAENPKVSGPGESEYMKEFASHSALVGAQRWQVKNPDGSWEDLTTDAYDDEAKPDVIYGRDRHDFGRSWVLSHLSNHDQQDNPKSLDHLRDLLKDGQAHKLANPKTQRSEVADLTDFMTQRLWWVPDNAKRDSYDDNHATMVADYLEKHADKELRHIKEEGKQGPFSYKVAVHLKPETMLDWDEVIGDHHKDAKTKIAQAYDQHVGLPQKSGDGKVNYMEASDGAGVYREFVKALGGDYAASEALFNAGIHGIRYKDQGSRKPLPSLHVDGEDILNSPGHHMTPDDLAQAKQLASLVRNDWRFHGLSTFGLQQYMKQQFELAQEFVNRNKEEAKKLGVDYDQANHRYSKFSDAEENLRVAKHDHEWVEKNAHRLKMVYPKPTYNYVIFHPDFVEALSQYNIKGEKLRDIGPGVHLKAVDNDPFKGEAK